MPAWGETQAKSPDCLTTRRRQLQQREYLDKENIIYRAEHPDTLGRRVVQEMRLVDAPFAGGQYDASGHPA